MSTYFLAGFFTLGLFAVAYVAAAVGAHFCGKAIDRFAIGASHWSPEAEAARPTLEPVTFVVPVVPLAGKASWYGERYRGRLTANGEKFDPDELTCASWDFPFNTRLRVTNKRTGAAVTVRVNDRGPALGLRYDRRVIVDLSQAAFDRIAPLKLGVAEVYVRLAREDEL